MKAFLAYSLNDDEEYIITALAQLLSQQGFYVSNGSGKLLNEIDTITLQDINTSNLFIGIITVTGNYNERVYQQWVHCQNRNIPAILFIEDRYTNLDPKLLTYRNVLRFNRNNPESAIDKIRARQSTPANPQTDLQEIMPYVLGGVALIALIALLSRN